ncbi:meiotic nuclear division protein 1 [Tuber borchii]|uniref:Meiotic nuclear division protein 1 n=1 Tax=Tuber borchii TaxID=42251 RepID=A0A2T6ZSR8_TUBBO|nr:meiotic nuclear division protein 1 [Tuber borchii]
MPPKSLPPAKLAQVLAHIQALNTTHTLKDLEKIIPPATGVSGMLVKDYLTALVDEGLLRVEKIGSGNWYWAFRSEETNTKRRILKNCLDEKDKLRSAISEAKRAIREIGAEEGEGSEELVKRVQELKAVKAGMVAEIRGYEEGNVDGLKREIEEMRDRINLTIGIAYPAATPVLG